MLFAGVVPRASLPLPLHRFKTASPPAVGPALQTDDYRRTLADIQRELQRSGAA